MHVCTVDSLFVCTRKHSKEHQPHNSPLPAPGLLLSSKRDPCRALQLHMTPNLPGNAVPAVLKQTKQVTVQTDDKNKTKKRKGSGNACLI